MDREKLLDALDAMQRGEKDAGECHDELETLTALVTNTSSADIHTAWEYITLKSEESDESEEPEEVE
jgi:hypothetical protein